MFILNGFISMFQVFFRRNRKKNVFFENTIRQRYSFVLNRCKLRYFIKHAQKHKGDKFHECRRLSFLDIYTKRMNPGGFAATMGFAPICFKCNRGSGFSVCLVYFLSFIAAPTRISIGSYLLIWWIRLHKWNAFCTLCEWFGKCFS